MATILTMVLVVGISYFKSKKYKKYLELQFQQKEFANKIVLITRMKHRNLVNLKGCCLHENSKTIGI
uniref:Serine-threonine/tyrosine-protein kinase catalytic domain-containing protein n=1 Tax=Physcomitrium patens TaxID=3218 RepID=A0A2K1JE64_PHYPA|nr:hypothetical protein PHYPA_020084 [Physcomitrium patens]